MEPATSGARRGNQVERQNDDEQGGVDQIQADRRAGVLPQEAQRGEKRAEHAPPILDHRAHLRIVEHQVAGGHNGHEHGIEHDAKGKRRGFHGRVAGHARVQRIEQPMMDDAEEEAVGEAHHDREAQKAAEEPSRRGEEAVARASPGRVRSGR